MHILIATLIVAVIVGYWFLKRTNWGDALSRPDSQQIKSTGEKTFLKRFGDLTSADFEQHPVWVHWQVIDHGKNWPGEGDEETFRPWNGILPVDPGETMFLVKAELILADGTEYDGFITPQPDGKPDLDALQPHLFTKRGGMISFWLGMWEPSRKEINRLYKSMGKTPDQIFPIVFKACDGLAKGVQSGSILGFCRLSKNKATVIER